MRVLVADDEPDIRTVVRVRLVSKGWAVEEATSGYEALAACRERHIDVAVLDQRMGGFTGMEVADILRRESFDRPVIIFSAYLDPDLEEEAARRGLMTIAKADIPGLVRAIAAYDQPEAID